MNTEALNLAILESDREPYNVITHAGLITYQKEGLSLYPHYEVVDQTDNGVDIYQCRIVIDGRERTCLLVAVTEDKRTIHHVFLTGRAEVDAHREKYFASV